MFFCKKIFTNFFYIKKQKTFPSFFFFDTEDFLEVRDFSWNPSSGGTFNLPVFKDFYISLRNIFFTNFFLYFFKKFILFSFYFFNCFFINSFFFKFVKFVGFFILYFFNFFFKKKVTLINQNFYFLFCFSLKNYLIEQNYFQIDLSFLVNYLKIDF